MIKQCLFPILILSCCLATVLSAAELETIENATLIEAGLNDGDSFKVRANGKVLHLRLYYVDCLETTAGTDAELETNPRTAISFRTRRPRSRRALRQSRRPRT